jgi:hypothetical protein
VTAKKFSWEHSVDLKQFNPVWPDIFGAVLAGLRAIGRSDQRISVRKKVDGGALTRIWETDYMDLSASEEKAFNEAFEAAQVS